MDTKQQLVTDNNISEFKEKVKSAFQKYKSKLRSTVTEKWNEGEASALIEVIKPSEVYEIIEDDVSETIYNNTGQDRRWLTQRKYGWAERIDPYATFDSYAKLVTDAMHRKQDEVILRGMLGANKYGMRGENTDYILKENIIPAVEGDNFFDTFI